MTLEEAKRAIKEPDQKAMELCQRRWDSIAKPLHSLGKLEDDLVKDRRHHRKRRYPSGEKSPRDHVCGQRRGGGRSDPDRPGSDRHCDRQFPEQKGHGQHPLLHGRERIFFPVDIGVAAETHVIDRKIAWGTKNMTKGPAMTREEAHPGSGDRYFHGGRTEK